MCPPVDRHTHLEGALEPTWVRREAAQRGLAIPESLEALWRGEATSFAQFVEAFLFASGFLGGVEAVRMAVAHTVSRLGSGPGPRGVDLWVSPHFLVTRAALLTMDELWRGLELGIADTRKEGANVAVVVDAVNHRGPDHGHAVLDLFVAERPSFVVGFSTGGQEAIPFRRWAPVFDRARKAGLRLAAHAGESGPGSNVRDAVLDAGVERIVHAVRAARDPELLALLAERRIPIDICLSSNRQLVPDLVDHPLPTMLRAGLRCALGTDDAGVIPCDLPGEWSYARGLGLSAEEEDALARHAVEDAWCFTVP